MTDSKPEVQTGVVSSFDDGKGIGFIICDDNGKHVFCHHSEIKVEGYRTLVPGQRVSFLRVPTEKRLSRANEIYLIDEIQQSEAA
jgi:CspA family cold shock protein